MKEKYKDIDISKVMEVYKLTLEEDIEYKKGIDSYVRVFSNIFDEVELNQNEKRLFQEIMMHHYKDKYGYCFIDEDVENFDEIYIVKESFVDNFELREDSPSEMRFYNTYLNDVISKFNKCKFNECEYNLLYDTLDDGNLEPLPFGTKLAMFNKIANDVCKHYKTDNIYVEFETINDIYTNHIKIKPFMFMGFCGQVGVLQDLGVL